MKVLKHLVFCFRVFADFFDCALMVVGKDQIFRDSVVEILRSISGSRIGRASFFDAVQDIILEQGNVSVVVEIEQKYSSVIDNLCREVEEKIRSVHGVTSASIIFTAHSGTSFGREREKNPSGSSKQVRTLDRVEGVKKIVGVGSGKGGVGKSTVAANLAAALVRIGFKTGLLDADIYGPSQPHMFGLDQCSGSRIEVQNERESDDKKFIIPVKSYGVTLMSMGFLIKENQSVIWRGPMLKSALQQMLWQVRWGELDVLIVDLPPGTGDISLTLYQSCKVDGLVVVSTPQEVSLLDVSRCIDMADKLDIPILGTVENMAFFSCPSCGVETRIFDNCSDTDSLEGLGFPVLASIPLNRSICVSCDAGAPIAADQPNTVEAGYFLGLAEKVAGKLFSQKEIAERAI